MSTIAEDLDRVIGDALARQSVTATFLSTALAAVEVRVAVLGWLGDLDPDADGALVAWHLRATRREVERLRAERDEARAEAAALHAIAERVSACGRRFVAAVREDEPAAMVAALEAIVEAVAA